MSRALPPLHTLAAFEAAARLGGFRQAAESLHLTPSAISHRIKQLETFLGKPLFERRHRGVALTADGRRYYAAVHDAFQRLADVTEALRETPRKLLRISAAPAVGSKWLVGRLTRFQEAHPEIDFELSTGTGLAPLLAGEADLGLRYGDEEWPGLDAWKLFDETVIVVCSPGYAARLSGLPAPAALDGARLLRHPLLSWQQWFAAAGLQRPEPAGPRYEDALLMLEATAAGQGVALITATLAAPYLASGALVQPVPATCPGQGFYAVAPRSAQEKPWVMDFIRWLVRDAHDFA
jgi:LysR family glycine cleavage system transcriptional activator